LFEGGSRGDATPHDEPLDVDRLEAIISALQISSQLARNSEKYYDVLSAVFTASKLVWLFTQTHDDGVVAKVCNLVGNLCRHSGRFYTVLSAPVKSRQQMQSGGSKPVTHTILGILANGCGDSNANIRKFSSFAGEFSDCWSKK
jgi:fused-like protein